MCVQSASGYAYDVVSKQVGLERTGTVKTENLVEVYEDNGGGLKLYAFADGSLVYGCLYYDQTTEDGYTAPEMCAADFVALTVQCIDPEADGWDAGDYSLSGIDYAAESGRLIASSEWYKGADSDMWGDVEDADGYAGRQFIATLEWRYTVARVMDGVEEA